MSPAEKKANLQKLLDSRPRTGGKKWKELTDEEFKSWLEYFDREHDAVESKRLPSSYYLTMNKRPWHIKCTMTKKWDIAKDSLENLQSATRGYDKCPEQMNYTESFSTMERQFYSFLKKLVFLGVVCLTAGIVSCNTITANMAEAERQKLEQARIQEELRINQEKTAEGEKAYETGDYATAVEAFEEAFAQSAAEPASGLVLYHYAVALEKTGYWSDTAWADAQNTIEK